MGFDLLVGQERAVRVLRSALVRARVAHAYLFAGPGSVGKHTAAVLFAQALNCEGEPADAPCGQCRSCLLIEHGNHPDVRLFTISADMRGRQRSEISIDQIRQDPKKPRETPPPLIHDAYLKPLGRHKVYIIDPADRMTPEASNALLKVLEEPPPQVALILVSSEPSSLLPTIVSRCQKVTFQLVGTRAIEGKLRQDGLEAETAAAIARLSGGRIGWAIQASRRNEVLAVRRSLLDLCSGMIGASLPASLRIAEQIKHQASRLALAKLQPPAESEEGEQDRETPAVPSGGDRAIRSELPWCLDVMVSWYRDLLAAGQGAPLLNLDYESALTQQRQPGFDRQAECAIESILETKHSIERNANVDLALESLVTGLVAWCD
ncbi:MAG: DNA polymerase III subunit delta' [Armatimonadota bacterium]